MKNGKKCDLHTGQCPCREGVMGQRCDQCQENYFYDQNIYQCQRCHKCYDLVQYSVNHHRIELKRLIELKDDILTNPHDFVDDAEFESKLKKFPRFKSDILQPFRKVAVESSNLVFVSQS